MVVSAASFFCRYSIWANNSFSHPESWRLAILWRMVCVDLCMIA